MKWLDSLCYTNKPFTGVIITCVIHVTMIEDMFTQFMISNKLINFFLHIVANTDNYCKYNLLRKLSSLTVLSEKTRVEEIMSMVFKWL